MTDQPLRLERQGQHVVLLTLDVPDRRNAMVAELTAAWAEAMAELAQDRMVRAVVVTGEGTSFCAGGDLSWIAESPDQSVGAIRERMLPFYRTWLSVRDLEVPVLAAVNGPAVGAGMCLALACDLRYASTTATFSAPFVHLGMHAGMAATYLLPELVGIGPARELLYTGRPVDAEESLRIGLVNAVLEPDALLPAVMDTAERIAAAAPTAVRLTKSALAYAGHRSIGDALEWEALAQPVTMVSSDLAEGLTAFSERRPPRFTGT